MNGMEITQFTYFRLGGRNAVQTNHRRDRVTGSNGPCMYPQPGVETCMTSSHSRTVVDGVERQHQLRRRVAPELEVRQSTGFRQIDAGLCCSTSSALLLKPGQSADGRAIALPP